MFRTIITISAVVTCLFSVACKKTKPDPVPGMYLWLGSDTLAYARAARLPQTPYLTAAGVFIAGKMSVKLHEYEVPVHYDKYWCRADFIDMEANEAEAGQLTINGIELPMGNPYGYTPATNYTYYHQSFDTCDRWLEAGANTWLTTGSGHIAPITYSMSGAFPEYTDNLPSVVKGSSELSVFFTSSNTQKGDYAFITLTGEYGHEYVRSEVVHIPGGVATIRAKWVARFAKESNRGRLGIHIYSISHRTFGGRPFVFIKLREKWQDVSFN